MSFAVKALGKLRGFVNRYAIEILDNNTLERDAIYQIEKKEANRTLSQNAFLHLYLNRAVKQIDSIRSMEELKYRLRKEFLTVIVPNEILGDIEVIRSTAHLTAKEFSQFINEIDSELQANEFYKCDMSGFWKEYEMEYYKWMEVKK